MARRPLTTSLWLLLALLVAVPAVLAQPSAQVVPLPGQVRSLAWLPDGGALLVSTGVALLHLDAATATLTQPFTGLDAVPGPVAVAADGRVALLSTTSADGSAPSSRLQLLSAAQPCTVGVASATVPYLTDGAVRWSPDGTQVLVAALNGLLIDATTGALVRDLPSAPSSQRAVSGGVVADEVLDGDWLSTDAVLLLTRGGRVEVWSVAEDAFVAGWPVPDGARAALPLAPGGRALVAATTDTLLVLDAATGTVQATLPNPLTSRGSPALRSLTWAADGSAFAAASFDHQVAVCHTHAKTCTVVWAQRAAFVGELAWQPGGTLLAFGARNAPNAPTLVLLDVADALAELRPDA